MIFAHKFLVFATLLSVLSLEVLSVKTLPVFKVVPQSSFNAAGRAKELAEMYNMSQFNITKNNSRITFKSDTHRIEVDSVNNGIWTADESRVWNHELRPQLPDNATALKLAEELVNKYRLLPKSTGPFALKFSHTGATYLDIQSETANETHQLDTRVIYTTTINIPDQPNIPVVGGGGEFQIVFGDKGNLIGYHGVWRNVDLQPIDTLAIPQEEVDSVFLHLNKNVKIKDFNSSLAYYSAPSFTAQEYLYPVYIYRSTAVIDGQLVPMRMVTLPATKFGPSLKELADRPPQKPSRSRKDVKAKSRRNKLTKRDAREFGTSWIGTSQGLPSSQTNAQGFVDELTTDGWTNNFNWGDSNAWESDWRRSDDNWVDAVDFVFYTGHANMNGWVLAPPDDNFLDFNEVGPEGDNPGDLWGQQDLDWMVIAACGPFQDRLLSPGGGRAIDRWGGAFDGLHLMLAYGAVTFETEDEGRRLVRYAKQGSTLIKAWFRAAQELQPSTNGWAAPDGPDVYVGAMWVSKLGVDPSQDHLWGHGAVSADPVAPTTKQIMWTTC